ncbi:hypothetical protein CDAR_524001 [Caerostris darwini]|uniref:Uncharacterized protein n=1 Tax=Caerostris darwini TaxID=1538125 RepID=A0AAV4TWJ4_9ARAC|nr:hypothetical protein CDAR_524001 [Caerostris darwini]
MSAFHSLKTVSKSTKDENFCTEKSNVNNVKEGHREVDAVVVFTGRKRPLRIHCVTHFNEARECVTGASLRMPPQCAYGKVSLCIGGPLFLVPPLLSGRLSWTLLPLRELQLASFRTRNFYFTGK